MRAGLRFVNPNGAPARPGAASAPDGKPRTEAFRVELRERDGGVELRCNGWELMSSRAHHSEDALAALACDRLPSRCPVILLGGLGLGYTLRALLDAAPQTARVTVAELLPQIIAWNRGRLGHYAGYPLADPRASVVCCDIAALLRAAEPGSCDAILLDVDNGPDAIMLAANAALYSGAGLQLIRGALRQNGVLAVWSADRSPRFERNLRRAGFGCAVHDVPARGAPDDPQHAIYLARPLPCTPSTGVAAARRVSP